ncbi:hypothetical protein D3273_14735 [Lichenibacterium minor]|uniref:Uncharacterized protein n=1 Tax=Lichenibacterium minor TaxID=2316528 RepID=A0A4Q2U4I8_9HYPH|nr:hypothetical protein [Lichenibacterium minor]RYC31150.1 hypothetical protein D3273_14735 [Lichenibacterium minor]
MPDNYDFLGNAADNWLSYWAKIPGWNISETAALLLGLDPDAKEELNKSEPFFRLRRLMFRARSMGIIQSPDTPKERVEWALSAGLPVPEALKELIYAGSPIIDWKTKAEKYKKLYRSRKQKNSKLEKAFNENAKSRNSLSNLIYIMAVEKYNFKRNYSPAAANICHAATKRGLENFPTPQVVANWLKLAADEVE